MPGLVAVVSLDGRTVEDQDLASALGRLVSPREERSAMWTGGGVGLAATALVAAHGTSSPLAVEGPLAVAVDARFDDPKSLGGRLHGLGEASRPALSNAELVLAAYRRWGLECLPELAGDFAFVLWDGERQRLFAARDAVGVRQLVWTRAGNRLLFASSSGTLLALLAQPPEPNWGLLADQIARNYDRWLEETAHHGIHRLPPGHGLTVQEGTVERRRWARLGECPSAATTEAQHVAAFRECLAAAVRSRLAAPTPAGLLVSGGLDSSSLACLAAREVPAVGITGVRLYSMAFEATEGADEGSYREAVFAHCPALPAATVLCDDQWALREFGTEGGFPLDEPERELTRGLVAHTVRRVVADGCGVILGGHWGDQVLGSGHYAALSVLQDVPWSRLGTELPHFRRHHRYPAALLAAWGVLSPLIGPGPRRWLTGHGRESARSRALLPPPPLPTQGAVRIHADLTSGVTAAALANLDRIGRWLGIEWRLPFLDRRVIESCLALPPALRAANGVSKLVLRRALKDVLPQPILERRGRATFDALVERGLRLQERDKISGLLRHARVVHLGLLSPEVLDSLLCNYYEREMRPVPYRDLASVLCVEAWLRNRLSSNELEAPPVAGIWETGG
jgi:asparagine synthase (glutamine-hydrolysing)